MKNATELKTTTDNYFKKKVDSCYEDSSGKIYKDETPLFLKRQEKIVQQAEEKKDFENLVAKKNPIYSQIEESIFITIAEKLEQNHSDLVKWVAPYNLHDSMMLALIIYMSPTTNLDKVIIDCFKTIDYAEIESIKQIILQKEQSLEGKSNEFLLNLSETKKLLTELGKQAINLWGMASEVLLEYKNSPEHILVVDIIKSNINHYTKSNNNIHDLDLLRAIENTLSKFL
jgi:hypothetical protein